jgi:hypothetical protein
MNQVKTETHQAFKLKALSKDGVDAALSKADQYRLLNQPKLAESICLDVLEIDKSNHKAKVILLLSLTDQFGQSFSSGSKHANELAKSLQDEYSKLYYMAIIRERMGTAILNSGNPGANFDAYEWYIEAMELFEKAEPLAPPYNNDTILRWNTCARMIMQYDLRERPFENFPPLE